MTNRLPILHASVQHLRFVVTSVEVFDPAASAYPTEWTVADTMSHIGSGAVILNRRLEDTIAGREADPTFNQSVWDEWNAKAPADQVSDALIADEEFLLALESLSDAQRSEFHSSMGPFDLDFDDFVGLRLGEHALHTWDIEMAFDPSARLSSDAAGAIIDNLDMLLRFAAKAHGEEKQLRVRTTEPPRDFVLIFADDTISLSDAAHGGPIDFEVPTEAFVRLVYGRLDPANAPSDIDEDRLAELQKSFPGI